MASNQPIKILKIVRKLKLQGAREWREEDLGGHVRL